MSAVRNILAVYGQASPQERSEGALWYIKANAVAQSLAIAHEEKLCVVVGVISALSPRNKWERNLRDACSLLADPVAGNVCAFGANRAKAARILETATNAGDVISLLGNGLKTRAFFWNIYTPDAKEHVTIDGHATTIASGRYRPLAALPALTPHAYGRLETAYREAARLADVLPTTMQATTWLTWRRIHGIE